MYKINGISKLIEATSFLDFIYFKKNVKTQPSRKLFFSLNTTPNLSLHVVLHNLKAVTPLLLGIMPKLNGF